MTIDAGNHFDAQAAARAGNDVHGVFADMSEIMTMSAISDLS